METKLVISILAAGISTMSAQSEERQRGPRENPGAIFDRADANKDEFVDLKELTAFRASMQQGQRGNQGRGGPNADAQERPEGAPAARPPRGETGNSQSPRGQRGPR
jgi:hypothetical protein